jgi:hypothetical protein
MLEGPKVGQIRGAKGATGGALVSVAAFWSASSSRWAGVGLGVLRQPVQPTGRVPMRARNTTATSRGVGLTPSLLIICIGSQSDKHARPENTVIEYIGMACISRERQAPASSSFARVLISSLSVQFYVP